MLAVFAVFFSKLLASEIALAAEILAHRRFDASKTARKLAVISLFSAVLVEECAGSESGASISKRLQRK